MKKRFLQIIVVLILVITFVAFPLLVYPPIPSSISLMPIAQTKFLANTAQDSRLIWLKHPEKERFFGIPKQKYADYLQNNTLYLVQTNADVDFFDAGTAYLIMPKSALGQFLIMHSKELNATPVYVLRSSAPAKYQVFNTLAPALAVTKQPHSANIVLVNLPKADYDALLTLKAHDPKLSNMIVQNDANQRTITINPTIHKADLTIWLNNVWIYFKNSFHLTDIFGNTDADTAHH